MILFLEKTEKYKKIKSIKQRGKKESKTKIKKIIKKTKQTDSCLPSVPETVQGIFPKCQDHCIFQSISFCKKLPLPNKPI